MPADLKNRSQLEAWLGKQPPEAAAVLAARAALRVLPVVQWAKNDGFTGVLVLPVFRTTVFSWAAANYPAHKTEFAVAAAAAYAAAVTAAAAAAVAVALATAEAAAIRADYNACTADAYAAHAAAAHARAADTYAAVLAARAAAAAARAADAYAEPRTSATVYAASYADAAAYAAAYADARTYAVTADARTYPVTTHAADSSRAAAAPLFWSALSSDATRLEKGAAASAIARSPLWPKGQPDELHSLWQEMKAALLAAKQDWQVWTIWYDHRLEGRVRDETLELAYVRIEEALWDQHPAVVNAEIERRIAMSSYEGCLRGAPRTSRLGGQVNKRKMADRDRRINR